MGFVFGWYIEQFSQTVYILGAGLVFAAIVSVLYKSRKMIIFTHLLKKQYVMNPGGLFWFEIFKKIPKLIIIWYTRTSAGLVSRIRDV